MKKPSESEAKALAKLFPSKASAKRQQAFDPHDECIATPAHKKKRRFGAPKLSIVSVVLLPKMQYSLPRGQGRKELATKGT